MKKHLFFFLFLFFLNLFSQTSLSQSHQNCVKNIKKADSLVQKKHYLESILLLEKQYKITKKNQWDTLHLKVCATLGLSYFETGAIGKALNYSYEAYTIAKKIKNNKNLAKILNNTALIYYQQKNYKKTFALFQTIVKYAKQEKDYQMLVIYLTNMGTVALDLKNIPKAKECMKEASRYVNKNNKEEILIIERLNLNILFNEKKYLELIEKGELLFEKISKNGSEKNDFDILNHLGNAYFKTNQYDKAIKTFLNSLSRDYQIQNRKDVYKLVSEAYQKKQDLKNAIVYKDSVIYIDEKLNIEKEKNNFEKANLRFQLFDIENQHKLKIEKAKAEKKILWYSSLALFFFVILLLIAIRYITIWYQKQQKLKELQLQETKIKAAANLLFLKQQKLDLEQKSLEEKKLLNESIEARNLKLTEQILKQENKNEFISKIITILENNTLPPSDLDNTALNRLIFLMKNQLKQDKKFNDIANNTVENVNPKLITNLRLKHPNLTPDDIKLLSCLFLNHTVDKIAEIMKTTPHAVYKRRERIVQKIGLSSTEDIFNHLNNNIL